MEYEIGDDPQGLPDHSEGDRDGGVDEGRVFFRRYSPRRPIDQPDDARAEDTARLQLS